MKKQEMENRIESIINCLDDARRASPGPFFYTRVQARLHRSDRTLWENLSGLLAKPAVAFTVICMVVSLNALVIFQSGNLKPVNNEQSFITLSDSELDIIAFYDQEHNNTDPQ